MTCRWSTNEHYHFMILGEYWVTWYLGKKQSLYEGRPVSTRIDWISRFLIKRNCTTCLRSFCYCKTFLFPHDFELLYSSLLNFCWLVPEPMENCLDRFVNHVKLLSLQSENNKNRFSGVSGGCRNIHRIGKKKILFWPETFFAQNVFVLAPIEKNIFLKTEVVSDHNAQRIFASTSSDRHFGYSNSPIVQNRHSTPHDFTI